MDHDDIGAGQRANLQVLVAELAAFRTAREADRGAMIGQFIEARAADLLADMRARDGALDDEDLAFEALLITAAEVSLAILRTLLEEDPAVVSLLGDERHARIAGALRRVLKREPLPL
jgi:hypothetical protein